MDSNIIFTVARVMADSFRKDHFISRHPCSAILHDQEAHKIQ
jgi:hypothetical protein